MYAIAIYDMLQQLNSITEDTIDVYISPTLYCTHCHDNRYELMQSCWRSEPHARLNFTQLKYSFKNIIFANNPMTSYVSIKPNVSSTRVAGNAPVRRSSQESNKEGQYERISAVNIVPT